MQHQSPGSSQNNNQPQHHQHHQQQGHHSTSATMGFELEEALFSTSPVGLHCVDAQGRILWANRTELGFLGFAKEEYVGRYVSNFVYSDKVDALGGSTIDQQHAQNANGGAEQQSDTNSVNLITADDKTLYKEVLKRVKGGNPINEIPVRFVTRSGTIIHLLLDCDGTAIPIRDVVGSISAINNNNNNGGRSNSVSPSPPTVYFRFFTRDDTARRIQEMRSNVLFQETNRSLQMLDNFMNRSMQQMRAPLTLMERACNLVTENIEDIDEVIRRNHAVSQQIVMANNNSNNNAANANNNNSGGGSTGGGGNPSVTGDNNGPQLRRSSNTSGSCHNLLSFDNVLQSNNNNSNIEQHPGNNLENDNGKPHAIINIANNNNNVIGAPNTPTTSAMAMADFTAPLSVALSATLEARSVVGLASTLTKDALALVDDITDLCRFDQGRVLLIEKEAVKVRDICLEALMKVPIPVGSNGMVDVVLDIQEGAPGRTMTDRSVFQRSLALLLNFAVDAAANAASTMGHSGHGKVILSITDEAMGQHQRSKSACRISVYYSNPPDASGDGVGVMGSTASANMSSAPMDATAFASAYTSGRENNNNNMPNSHQSSSAMGSNNMDLSGMNAGGMPGMQRMNSFGKLPAIFGECYSKPEDEAAHEQQMLLQQNYQSAQGGSMMRRIRLRESIQSGMTSCRRDKLGLGLSLLYHLVGAQGSDLRYEIVSESPPTTVPNAIGSQRRPGVTLPSMTKFWFLLPMSLDFPDRLPAEHIVKDDLQQNQRRPSLSSMSLPNNSFSMAPPDNGLSMQQQQQQQQEPQQPPLKRARLSSQQQQPAVAAVNPLNSILSANVMGAAMGDNAPLFNNRPDAAPVASAAHAPVAAAAPKSALRSSSKTTTTTTTTTKQYPGVVPGARPLVLVVEDTDVSASLLCMHLRKLNCTSHRAENGEVAIEMLRSAPSPNMYSLILMDLRMPVMDGFEATKIIKGSNASNIPVVALTGETSEEHRQRCNEIGFDDYKTKPLKRPQLKELLNKLVPGYISV